mmetsp:Transcript_10904/g.22291  ORF Transcript_10904/g.22291 Transcript_10904/m.22291 type:complete len:370 (+) Transcript_10904:48-1157(+)
MAIRIFPLPLSFSVFSFAAIVSLKYSHASSTSGNAAGSGGGVYGGRHSYSLTTFDPSGNLDQVVRAIRASTLGVPIVAYSIPAKNMLDRSSLDEVDELESSSGNKSLSQVITKNVMDTSRNIQIPDEGGIYFCVPLRFLTSSPLMLDDGTPRFVAVSTTICVSHTGVGADGRSLCDIAVKLALDYKFLYGDEISVEELLEGVAEKVQEMTMKGGYRPFGCALLVGSLGDEDRKGPAMYQVDPSGAVEQIASFNSKKFSYESLTPDKSSDEANSADKENINGRKGLAAFLGYWGPAGRRIQIFKDDLENTIVSDENEVRTKLKNIAQETFVIAGNNVDGDTSDNSKRNIKPVLFASFTRQNGLRIKRILE